MLRAVGIFDDIRSFASTLPELELYLPIATHRDRARTAALVQVAVRSEAGDAFLILRPDGTSFRVGEHYDPGVVVTVVLGKSEIDYDVASSAVRGGASTGSGILATTRTGWPVAHAECDPEITNCGGGGGGGGTAPPPSGGDTSRRTEFFFIQLNEHSEGLLMGLNEIEIFGSVNNGYHSCGSVTEVHYGTAYAITFLASDVARRVATAVPVGESRFTLEAFEDDDDRCVKRPSDDPLGKWSTGITISQYGRAFTTESPGLLRLAVGTVNQ